MNKPSKQQLIEEINKKLSLLASYDETSKEQEFSYPIFKRNPNTGTIIKFTAITTGTIVWIGKGFPLNIGCESNEYMNHTCNSSWKDVAYDSDRELWDKQPVYCWDDDDTHSRRIEFYNALNDCIFTYNGKRNDSSVCDNYEAIETDRYDDWILEAFNILED